MSVCAGYCAGGHYTDPNGSTSVCPLNTKESKGGVSPGGIRDTTSNFGSTTVWAMGEAGTSLGATNPRSGYKIYDTDIIYTLINAVNSEITRYNTNPRHDNTGAPIAFAGGSALVTGTNYDQQVVTYPIWLNIVKKVQALQMARGLPVSIATSPVDKADGADLIDAPFIRSIINALNSVAEDTSCGIACKCNVVCNCNGNCGCNYSDERLKENIFQITGEESSSIHAELSQTKLYEYNYNSVKSELPTDKQYGVIAQQLIGTRFESFLQMDEDGYYNVDYARFIPVVINSVQYLETAVQVLSAENNTLMKKVETIENHLKDVTRYFTPHK